MNVVDEKQHVYNIIRQLTEERRLISEERLTITQQIGDWKLRLDELQGMEQAGIEELRATGYVELRNRADKLREISNVAAETKKLLDDINTQAEHISTRGKIEEVPPVENKIPIKDQEEQKDRDTRAYAGKNRGTDELLTYRVLLTSILKAEGMPMKAEKLHERLQAVAEQPITHRRFINSVLYYIVEHNPKIQNVSRGYYQYVL